jgi:hypothetical protein
MSAPAAPSVTSFEDRLRVLGGLLSPLVPLVAALVLWAPIRDNYFHSDDFVHLYDVVTRGALGLLTQIWGGHLITMPNLVRAVMFPVFGPDPRPYFWLMLFTHVVNVLLLHRVIRRFTADRVLACFGATLWGTCPALEGALGWHAVYGQVILTTMVLAALAHLGSALAEGGVLAAPAATFCGALLAVGGASFGTGLGIAAAFPAMMLLALPRRQRPWSGIAILVLAAAAVFALYAVARIRSPDLDARARELLSLHAALAGLPATLLFEMLLIGAGLGMLFLGFLWPDAVAPWAISAVASAVLGIIVPVAWLRSDGQSRRRLLGLAVLVLAAYGAVAIGRTNVLRAVSYSLPTAAEWPRYHYLPLALLAILACAVLARLRARSARAGRLVLYVVALWMAARGFVLVTRPLPIDHHAADRTATEAALGTVRAAVAATPPGGTARIENRPFPPMLPFPGVVFPGLAGVFVVYFPENAVDGRPVRFVVSAKDWEQAEQRGGRIAALVVPAPRGTAEKP